MQALTQWFERQAEIERRTPCLEDAFVRDRFLPYALYRLRFFLARSLINWGLHVAGVWLLQGVLTRRQFGVVALAHLLAAFASSCWWGGLEEMRGRIRHWHYSGRPQFITGEVSRWLALSLRLSACILFGGALWVGWFAAFNRSSSVFVGACLFSIVLRLALEIPFRCYHSGLYAIRRVYRPLPAMIAVDFVSFLMLVILWRAIGRWSYPLTSLFSSLAVTAVGLYYTTRSYRLIGLEPFRCLARRCTPQFDKRSVGELIAAGLASGVMSLDALVALVALTIAARRGASAPLFVLLFAISPAIRAGYEWAQLFYFDLKRLQTAPFGNLSAWLGRRVFLLGWLVGPLFWLAACTAAFALAGPAARQFYLPLLAFFHSRSLLAVIGVRTFTEGAYKRLIGTGLLLLAAYVAAAIRLDCGHALLGLAVADYAAVAGLFLVFTILPRLTGFGRRLFRPPNWRRGKTLAPGAWLREVNGLEASVHIVALRYCPDRRGDCWKQTREESRAKARRLAGEIAQRLGRKGAVTLMHPGRILWYEAGSGCEKSGLVSWSIVRGAGLLEVLGETAVQTLGASALREARAQGFFGNDVRTSLTANSSGARHANGLADPFSAEARSAFLRMFPAGLVWTPGVKANCLACFSPNENRKLLADASVFSRDLFPNGRRSGCEVTALCDGHSLRCVFVAPPGSDARARSRWRVMIRRLNLDAAMNPTAKAEEFVTSGEKAVGYPGLQTFLDFLGQVQNSKSETTNTL